MRLAKSCLVAFFIAILLIGCSEEDKTDSNAVGDTKTTEKSDQRETNNKSNNKSNHDGDSSKENDGDTKLEDIPHIPTDVIGLSGQQSGPFAEDKNLYDLEEKIKKEFEKLGPMSANPKDEEYEKYLRFIYWLVSKDYSNPEDTIKKWKFAEFGNPDLPDSRYHFKENYNIEVILDSSGSMAADAGGQTRMELAKEAINQFLSNIPEKANVSLRVYGYNGSSSESDKKMSCNAIKQVYGFAPYQKNKFQEALNKFSPKGWTPIASALKQSEKALSKFDAKNNTNLIYLVSDGIGTCDGNPVKIAKELSKSNSKPIINIIGFQTDAKAQKQLEEMAKVSDGIYASAENQEELKAEFERGEKVLEAWKKWKEESIDNIDAKEVENSFDILEIHNEWSFNTLETSNDMASVADVAQNIGIITHEQKEELNTRRREFIDEIDNTVDELEEKLKKISVKNIEELKKSINEKYNKQTQNE